MTDRPLTQTTRQELVDAIQPGMLFDGRNRAHHWDRITAQIAAEKLADYLGTANFVIMRGPSLRALSMDTSFKPEDEPKA